MSEFKKILIEYLEDSNILEDYEFSTFLLESYTHKPISRRKVKRLPNKTKIVINPSKLDITKFRKQ